MDKYIYNKRPGKAESMKHDGWWTTIVAVLLMLVLITGGVIFTGRDQGQIKAFAFAYSAKFKIWFTERKGRAEQKLASVKWATKPDQDEPIKFEFYQSLPDRQMKVSQKKQVDAPVVDEAEDVISMPASPIILSQAEKPAVPTDIFNADALEADLAQQVQRIG